MRRRQRRNRACLRAQICANWDYTPSRETTALVSPFFEYALFIYVVLDFLLTAIAYRKRHVSRAFWALVKVLLPIQILMCMWIRLIFVMLAYSSVRGHTVGFLGLQVLLITITVVNTGYILDTGVHYRFLGGVKVTKIVFAVYLACNLLVAFVKLYLTLYIVMGWGLPEMYYPEWARAPVGSSGKVVGQYIDLAWLFFNAIMPLPIAWIRARTEPKLSITLDLEPVRHVASAD